MNFNLLPIQGCEPTTGVEIREAEKSSTLQEKTSDLSLQTLRERPLTKAEPATYLPSRTKIALIAASAVLAGIAYSCRNNLFDPCVQYQQQCLYPANITNVLDEFVQNPSNVSSTDESRFKDADAIFSLGKSILTQGSLKEAPALVSKTFDALHNMTSRTGYPHPHSLALNFTKECLNYPQAHQTVSHAFDEFLAEEPVYVRLANKNMPQAKHLDQAILLIEESLKHPNHPAAKEIVLNGFQRWHKNDNSHVSDDFYGEKATRLANIYLKHYKFHPDVKGVISDSFFDNTIRSIMRNSIDISGFMFYRVRSVFKALPAELTRQFLTPLFKEYKSRINDNYLRELRIYSKDEEAFDEVLKEFCPDCKVDT